MPHYIFPSILSLSAFKWGPYKNTAHAVAELIDNSADAHTEEIGVAIFVDGDSTLPVMIATLDSGVGMNEERLGICLQYGFGEEPSSPPEGRRRQSRSRKRLGRFGVGLLSASFSQCSDVQVMSWQERETADPKGIPFVRLSLEEDDENVKQNQIPDVAHERLPKWATKAFVGMSTPITELKAGTLVIWRDLRPSWKRAKTLQDHILELCGRIHREFIRHDLMAINVSIYNLQTDECKNPKRARPIDPTFLHNWDAEELKNYGFVGNKTLFRPFTGHEGDSGRDAEGEYKGESMDILDPSKNLLGRYVLKASCRSDDVRDDKKLRQQYPDPGQRPYGKLAKMLEGVSIMRASREITLDDGWLRLSKTVDRWLSVSVDFDPGLDHVFGISNDKQQARSLSELAPKTIQYIKDEIKRVREQGLPDEWEYLVRLKVAHHIKERLQQMQKIVAKQGKDTRLKKSGTKEQWDPTVAPTPELRKDGDRISEGERDLPVDSHKPSSDPDGTREVYGDSMSGSRPAKEVRPPEIMEHDLSIDYVRDPYAPPSRMFHQTLGTGHMVVHFHEKHPLSVALSNLLVEPSESKDEDSSPEPTMQDALGVIRGLIASFARIQAEAENYDSAEAANLERALLRWSEKASYVFRDQED